MKHNTTSSRPAGRRSTVTMRGFALRPLAFAALVLTQGVQALPTGIQPTVGVQVNQTDASNMVITTTAQKTIINTQTFGIAAQEKLTVTQPGVTSSTMFSVKGYDPSYILGAMQSNGRIFLQNPNGIVFGANARVDVGGLVAMTMHLSDSDFMAGRYLLTDDGNGQGDLAGRVINQGTINAPHGSVVLAGREVINSGQILAEGGRVGLIAASKVLVDVEGDGLLFFQVEGKEAGARLEQLGRIEANGGSVELMAASRGQMADTVLNMGGVVQARTLGMKNGRVVIDGGDTGITAVSGTVDVTGAEAGQKGGDAVVEGQRVLVGSTALIDASGSAGGGQVRVGGGFHGADASVRNADMVTVQRGARIKANALTSGNGGQVAIWSNMGTRFFGNVEARGAGAAGEGGFVEVSGQQFLDYSGLVDVTAESGLTGTLLLDPTELTIIKKSPGNDNNVGGAGTEADPFKSSGSSSTLTWDTIKTALSTANTKVQTSTSDILIKDSSMDLASSNTLILLSAANVVQGTGANILNTGSGGLTLQSAVGSNVFLNGSIKTGGTVTLIGGSTSLSGISQIETTGTTAKIDIQGAVQGTVLGTSNDLTLTTANTTDANAITLGAVSGVRTLQVNGNATLGGDVSTLANQTYTSGVKLGANPVELKTSNATAKLSLQGAVDGNGQNLKLTTANVADADAIKTSNTISNVATLTVAGKSTLGGNVTTTGDQSYSDVVTLGANAQLDAGSSKIALTSVDGGTKDLVLKSTNAGADAIKTSSTIGNVAALTVTGKSTLGGNVTTTGNQSYSDVVTLGANAQLDAGSAKIALAGVDGGTKDLVLKSTNAGADAIKTSGVIGNVAALTVTGKSTLGGNVTTTGNQSYSDVVTLGANAQLDAGSSKIALTSVDGGGKDLVLKSTNAGADAIKTGSTISNVAALTVTGKSTLGGNVTSTGDQSYSNTVTLGANAQLDAGNSKIALASVDGGTKDLVLKSTNAGADAIKTSGAIGNVAALTVTGKSTLGGNVTTTGNQIYSDTVTLGANTQLDAGSAKIELAGVDGGAKDLALKSSNAAADAIKTSGAIGNVAALTVTGKSTLGGNVTSTGDQRYGDVVKLGANVQLDAGSAKIELAGVDGGTKDLTLKSTNAAADAIKTGGAIGDVAALTMTGKSTLGGDVTSTGKQSYGDVVTLGGADSTRVLTSGSDIDLGAVAGAGKNLTVAASGKATLGGAISGVATLDTTGSGTTQINTDINATTQRYGSSVLGGLGTTRTLAGTNVTLAAVDGGGKSLSVVAADRATLGGDVSNVQDLIVSGTVGITVGANVTTVGTQTYNGNVSLNHNATFRAPSLIFNNSLDAGSHNLGLLTKSWSVGGLGGVNGSLISDHGNIQISDNEAGHAFTVAQGASDVVTADQLAKFQTAGFDGVTIGAEDAGAITVGGGVTPVELPTSFTLVSGSTVSVNSAVTSAHGLTIRSAGDATLTGPVNAGSLTVDSGAIKVGANVITTGDQTYTKTVQLVAAPVQLQTTGPTSKIDLQGGVDGNGQNLSLVNTANTAAADAIKTGGAISNVATLNVAGKSTLGGNVTTTGNQAYTDAVTLGANAQLDAGTSKIALASVNGGAHNLTLASASASADAIKTTGAISNVAALTVAGKSTLGGNVTTSGSQTYQSTITLASNPVELKTTGATAKIDLQGAVNGNGQSLTLTNTANTIAADALKTGGVVSNVAAFKADGRITLGGDVLSSGTQAYTRSVTLGNGPLTLTTTGATARIDVQGQVDGNGQSLTLNNTANTTDADAIRLSDAVNNVATLVANGRTTVGGNIATSGDQQYLGTLALVKDVVSLSSTAGGVSMQQLDGATNELQVTAPGGLTFHGNIANLRGLKVLGSTTTTMFLNGGGLTTTNDQLYEGDVKISGDATFSALKLSMQKSVSGLSATQPIHNLTLIANQMAVQADLAGTGELKVAPSSAGLTMGVNGAPGSLQIDLDKVSGFTQRTIGSDQAGDISANAMKLAGDTTIKTGGNVVVNGNIDGGHALTVEAKQGQVEIKHSIDGEYDMTDPSKPTVIVAPLTDLTVTAQTISFAGNVLHTTGAQRFNGDFRALNPFALSGASVSLRSSQALELTGLSLTSGGSIETQGLLTLNGNVWLGGGELILQSDLHPSNDGVAFKDSEWSAPSKGLTINNRVLREAEAGIEQTGGVITTAAGSRLNLRAPNRGSILIDHTENQINGDVVAVSGPAGDTDASRFQGSGKLPVSYVRIDADQIHSAGIEADAVKLSTNALTTAPGTKIRARLPYINAQGTDTSLPALILAPKKPNELNLFGSASPSTWIQVDVGDAGGGYVTVRTKGLGSGSSTIFLGGPDSAVPFYDGTGKASEIQIYYNGRTPSTPQEVGALNAVTAVIEESRRARFEEVVRTENVSARLRQGVIAEVGSGRPATEGSESIRMPQSCTPTNGLGC